MGDAKLVFLRPHDGSGRLVFGDGGGEEAAPDVVIGMDADLPGLDALALRTGPVLGMEADLPGLDGAVGLAWDANVSRGGLRAELQACWQEARPLAVGLDAGWQLATPLRAAVASAWQEGERLRGGVSTRWQETGRLRAAIVSAWQEGAGLRGGLVSHWQEQRRLRAAVASAWQEGERLRAAALGRWRDGVRIRKPLRTHWQEARRPPSGVSLLPPVEPPREPCYDPATSGRLVFVEPWDGGGRLVFVCERGGVQPPATVVVPALRSYVVINSIEIRRADALAGDPLPSESFQMQLNRESWTWTFSATFHAAARDALALGPGGEPVELEVRVNGQPFRMQAEGIGRSRRFPEHLVTVRGRGLAAVLDGLNAPVQTFSQALDRTAQQLMTEVLTVNGVGFGWTVDFQLADWLVPGGVWMHQGSPISALAEIARATGGYLQPHDTDPVLRVLPVWPLPWWEWASSLVPDFDLPPGAAEADETEVIDQPGYNRVFVSGEAGGIVADLTRYGTPGDVLKQPMAVHPLITTIDAAKDRARAELSESGRALKHTMTLPVLSWTGVLKPGHVLRYYDDTGTQRLGIVRATGISQQFPVLTQTLEIASHADA